MVKNFLTNIAKSILVTSFLTSCVGIPARKVKLENYPEVNETEVKNLSLSYEDANLWNHKNIKDGQVFNKTIDEYLEVQGIVMPKKKSNCVIKISSAQSNDFFTCPIITNIIAPFTLFIVPLYCQENYHAKAQLLSTKSNKLLKEYYLKDKVHEVWSSIWFLLAIPIKPLRKGYTPEGAKDIVEQTISEALTRQIIHDANQFPECIKSPQDIELEKKLSQEEKKQQEIIKKQQELIKQKEDLRKSKIKGTTNINLKPQQNFNLVP